MYSNLSGKILYHGTTKEYNEVDLNKGRGYKDFGKGFYLSLDRKDALYRMESMYNRSNDENKKKILYSYEVNEEALWELSIKVFNSPDVRWLDFLFMCRNNCGLPHDYDVVIGPIADVNVDMFLNFYTEGSYGKVGSIRAVDTLLDIIELKGSGTQVFIGTKKGLSLLGKRKVEYFNAEK